MSDGNLSYQQIRYNEYSKQRAELAKTNVDLGGRFDQWVLTLSAGGLGLSLAFLLANYFLEILGSFWTDAQWTQAYSLFHHFQPGEILAGKADPLDLALLFTVMLVPLGYALWRFPRRDLAAPA